MNLFEEIRKEMASVSCEMRVRSSSKEPPNLIILMTYECKCECMRLMESLIAFYFSPEGDRLYGHRVYIVELPPGEQYVVCVDGRDL